MENGRSPSLQYSQEMLKLVRALGTAVETRSPAIYNSGRVHHEEANILPAGISAELRPENFAWLPGGSGL